MSSYQQADIVVVKFPFTDGSNYKKRPALVISNDIVNRTGDYLIVQITSKLTKDGLSIAIQDSDCSHPLPLTSYVRVHKIFTVNESHILSILTSVNTPFFETVTKRISELIDN